MKWFFVLYSFLGTGLILGQEYYFRQMPAFNESDIQLISTLYQSSDQMVWVGTNKGVFSFDGRKYNLALRPDSQLKRVTSIQESPEGQIWTGYEDGYLHAINSQGSTEVIQADSLIGVSISKILFHQPDKTFIATYGKGVWLLEKGNWSRIQDQALAQIDDIYDAVIDHKGNLWLATDDGIWIYAIDGSHTIIHLDHNQGLPDEIVSQLELESNGDIWIGLYDHGLARYIAANDTIISLMTLQPSDEMVVDMIKGRAGDIWLCTKKTVSHYSISRGKQSVKLPAEIKDQLGNILFDKTGNLWLASGKSLSIINTQLEFVTPEISNIQAIATANGKIWLGCEQGLYSMDQENHSVVPYLQKEKINILSIYADPSGILWIGTFGQGLYIFNPDKNQFRRLTEKDNISNNSILNIDGTGSQVWLATLGGITEIRWQDNPIQHPLAIIDFQDKYGFYAGYVFDVYASNSGVTWFGTDGKGMYFLEREQLHRLDIDLSEYSNEEENVKTIYSITADREYNIWISLPKGIILQLDPSGKVLQQITTSQYPPTLITSDQGEILMIQEESFRIRSRQGEMYFFNEASGLKSFKPTINAAVKDPNGTIWIAGDNRLLHYIPFEQAEDNLVVMHLENNFNTSITSGETIKLKPEYNFLDLRFTGLWYQNPNDVRYRYKLEGHDLDWINTHEGRAVYSRLAPGDYTFLVAGSHSDDFTSAKPLRKQIIVLPPFYQRWWFILGSLMLIAWILYTYIKARIKRVSKLHQLEKEKTMLQLHAIQAQVNPHFLFNSFNTLASIIEEDQHAAVNYVDQLSGFFRGVLLHRNAELIRMDQEMEIVRNYTYILQKRYGDNLVILENIHPVSGLIAPLSVQLLVENAIKHNIVSAEKPLTIQITMEDHMIKVSNPVQPKIQMGVESTGFGLSSLVTRYQYLTDRKIEILREDNIFTVKIPIIQPDFKS